MLKEKDVEFQLSMIEPKRRHDEPLQGSSDRPQVTNFNEPLVFGKKRKGQDNCDDIAKIERQRIINDHFTPELFDSVSDKSEDRVQCNRNEK